jgi:hypothetical protein
VRHEFATPNTKENMKTKYTVVIVATALGLAATLFAAEQQAGNAALKVITLKSHGVAVAEVRLLKSDTLHVSGQTQNYDARTGVLTSRGGVTIQLGSTGDSPITIKADEAEVISIAK